MSPVTNEETAEIGNILKEFERGDITFFDSIGAIRDYISQNYVRKEEVKKAIEATPFETMNHQLELLERLGIGEGK